ncbi:hypothetical protein RI129_001837 [Pyrocoelia pectoralis]|uniref:Gamma-interferon-inducible lysosomal thiol reductase n=1 Tax=Pyrocoelia pectoralis TaxID=417401 RepID=A0AAN7VWU8_9COLE
MNSLLSVIVLVGAAYIQHVSCETLHVAVYYESLCPDSIRFITKQLEPAYKHIGSNLEVDLVPYGKASQIQQNSVWSFECQHGPEECRGNKLQACGLAQSQDQDQKVDFVGCVMAQNYPPADSSITMCASRAKLNGEAIIQCADSAKGDELLAINGDKTHAVTPRITFVPTIVFDGVFDSIKQYGALFNFLKTACNEFQVKPMGCNARNDEFNF